LHVKRRLSFRLVNCNRSEIGLSYLPSLNIARLESDLRCHLFP
jgi:hypothetical protein